MRVLLVVGQGQTGPGIPVLLAVPVVSWLAGCGVIGALQ